jgi:Protein of unknown function (DUF3035).
MKKICKLLFFFTFIVILNSCGTIKEGFSSNKKNSTDEFLVKKKSPLVMPPEFDELPVPTNSNENPKKDESSEIKLLIDSNQNSSSQKQNSSNSNSNFESSILEKIKNN